MKKRWLNSYSALFHLRRLSQVTLLAVFILVIVKGSGVEYFFYFDPLIAIALFLSQKKISAIFLLSMVTLIFTAVSGRVFCGWICPLGTINYALSRTFERFRKVGRRGYSTVRWCENIRYYLLAFIVGAGVASINLSGVFDPVALLYRSLMVVVFPVFDYSIYVIAKLLYLSGMSEVASVFSSLRFGLLINARFNQTLLIGTIFVLIIALNYVSARLWCRFICPLGALLGIVSKVSLLRLSKGRCTGCGLCSSRCLSSAIEGVDGSWKWDRTKCIICLGCIHGCREESVTLKFSLEREPAPLNVTRRAILFWLVGGGVLTTIARLGDGIAFHKNRRVIRPPGSVPEEEFVAKCIRCGMCMKACPTNGLQPLLFEGGVACLWSPQLVPRIGYCEYYCNLCGQLCPTGAISMLSVEDKIKQKIGVAVMDKEHCLPYAKGIPCLVCVEHCPTSPKAFKVVEISFKGKKLMAPEVVKEICIGCGICESKCPEAGSGAIYVVGVGPNA